MDFEIVLGTHNKKKLREMQLLLQPHGVVLKTLADFPEAITVDETGSSFAENAALKATVQAKKLNRWVIGEDSGLSVDALGGAPGIHSARFAGDEATDEANNDRLLAELENVPSKKRTAFYTSHVSLSDPQGNLQIDCENYCRGLILKKRLGDQGFGYDPLFFIPEYGQTFGQLGDAVKSMISHRARAMRHFVRELLRKMPQW